MKLLDYLLLVGYIASTVLYFYGGTELKLLAGFIGAFCLGGFVSRLAARWHKRNNQ